MAIASLQSSGSSSGFFSVRRKAEPRIRLARRIGPALLALTLLLTPSLGFAQFTDGYTFIKAVKDRKGQEVNDLLAKPVAGAVLVNTRDPSNGETALHIVVKRRDTQWLRYLLSRGADPNLRDNAGITPLLVATRMRYNEGITILTANRARTDLSDNVGMTPLIQAVQNNDLNAVQTLIKAGANPDKTDNAGLSAKDYAARDGRRADLMKLLNDAPARRPVMGPR